MYGISKNTQKLAEKYRKRGYSITKTTDFKFLSRKPGGRKDMKRTGIKLGTGNYGGRTGGGQTVYAYKDIKITRRKKK